MKDEWGSRRAVRPFDGESQIGHRDTEKAGGDASNEWTRIEIIREYSCSFVVLFPSCLRQSRPDSRRRPRDPRTMGGFRRKKAGRPRATNGRPANVRPPHGGP